MHQIVKQLHTKLHQLWQETGAIREDILGAYFATKQMTSFSVDTTNVAIIAASISSHDAQEAVNDLIESHPNWTPQYALEVGMAVHQYIAPLLRNWIASRTTEEQMMRIDRWIYANICDLLGITTDTRTALKLLQWCFNPEKEFAYGSILDWNYESKTGAEWARENEAIRMMAEGDEVTICRTQWHPCLK